MADHHDHARFEGAPPEFALNVGSDARSGVREWTRFVGEHRDWWERHQTEGPLYALPKNVINALAALRSVSHGMRAPILTEQEGQDEHAFYKLCCGDGPSTIGVQEGLAIRYELLGRPLSLPSASQLQQAGMFEDKDQIRLDNQLQEAAKQLDRDAHQRLGYVGKLLFDGEYQAFRVERSGLLERWRSLRAKYRPPRRLAEYGYPDRARLPAPFVAMCLPLQPQTDRPAIALDMSSPIHFIQVPDDVLRFLEQVTAFLRKWQLASLVTWHLAVPQGRLEAAPLGAARAVRGPGQTVDVYPTYYDISSKEDVRSRVREEQAAAARDAGIDTKHPVTDISDRKGRPSLYESAVRLWFIEVAIRLRYGNPHGLTAALTPEFRELLGVGDNRLKQIRELYAHTLDDIVEL